MGDQIASTQNPKNTWWDFISEAMERKGMTAAELADAAGFNPSTLSHWKKGNAVPRLELVRATAKALDVNFLDALLASGLLGLEDLKLERVRPDLSLISDEEILAEAARRMLELRKKVK